MNELRQKITNYWNNQPCNIRHSSSEIGSLDFFKENSSKRYFVEPHIKDFAQFHLYQGKRILEIGCGIGADAEEFVRHGAEYVGIDISETSLELAKKRFELNDLKGEFILTSGDAITNLGKFDLVYSIGVLHHYPEVESTIEQIHQVLNDSGEFKFMVYAKNSWKYAMIRKGLDQFEAQAGCPYARVYTQDDVYDLLDGKFKIARIRQDHCFMYDLNKYKQHTYELAPWFAAMPNDMRDAIKEYLGWHLLVKAYKI